MRKAHFGTTKRPCWRLVMKFAYWQHTDRVILKKKSRGLEAGSKHFIVVRSSKKCSIKCYKTMKKSITLFFHYAKFQLVPDISQSYIFSLLLAHDKIQVFLLCPLSYIYSAFLSGKRL